MVVTRIPVKRSAWFGNGFQPEVLSAGELAKVCHKVAAVRVYARLDQGQWWKTFDWRSE